MAFDFKKMVADDRRLVFLNLAEFGEEHKVDGKTITVVLDDNALKERQGGQELGVAESSLMLYAAVEDLPPRAPGGRRAQHRRPRVYRQRLERGHGVATIALGQTVTM